MIKKGCCIFVVFFILSFLAFCYAEQENKFISYITEVSNVSNINLYDITTSETSQVTHFLDEGTVYSVSTDEVGNKIIFTRPSPDNGRINSTIWSVYVDGSGLSDLVMGDTEIDFKYACISPDGTKIAYCANTVLNPDDYQLYSINSDGSSKTQLTFFVSPHSVICSYPIFVDNSTVLFKVKMGVVEDYYTIDITSPGVVTNRTDNILNPLYFPRLGRPLLSSQKDKIIYAKQIQDITGYSNWNIYTLDLNTSSENLMIDNLYYVGIDPLDQLEPAPTFVQDSQLSFIGTQDGATFNLYITNLPVINPYQQRITYFPFPYLPYFFTSLPLPVQFAYVVNGKVYLYDENGNVTFLRNGNNPAFNWRGTGITYVSGGIKMVRVDGSNEAVVESSDSNFPAFSPDNRWIAYVKDNDIWARLTDLTNSPRQLTSFPSIQKSDISFSPAGNYIIYTGITGEGEKHIFKLPIVISYGITPLIDSTGNPVDLTQATADNYNPCISPDGSLIAFISTRNQVQELWKMDTDGNNQQKIIFDENTPQNPEYPHFSPNDSDLLCYVSGSSPQIWMVDFSQGNLSGQPVSPVIFTSEKFSWGKVPSEIVNISRFLVFGTIDPRLPLKYNLTLNINMGEMPESLLVEETIPETWIITEVKVNDETKTESNIVVSNGKKTYKWMFGASGIAPVVENSIIELNVDLNNDTVGNEYSLAGTATITEGGFLTTGDSYVILNYPYIPSDINQDEEISDMELLDAIDYWANGNQIHGWPVDVDNEWDYWLLELIDFWANANGYEYDLAGSLTEGEPRWQKQ